MAWRRQWCHLCELPKPPWAVVGDFSQAVCRGCVNFEGAGRVELLLAAARHLRGHHEATNLSLSPSVPKELREALCTEHRLRGHHEATNLSLSPSVPKELREALCGHITSESTWGHHEATNLSPSVPKELSQALCGRVTSERRLRRRHHRDVTAALPPARDVSPSVPAELSRHRDTLALSPSVPAELSDALHGRVTSDVTERHPRRHHRDVTVPLDVSPSVPAGLSEALGSRVTFGGAERRRHHHASATRALSPSVPAELSRHRDTLALSPSVPTELSEASCGRLTSEGTDGGHQATPPAVSPAVPAALSAALAEAWPGKPRAVRERLSVLAGCAPFAVRFRKDHALVGRVLAFDAAPRGGPGAGGDFELRLFAEYPCGSGSVYGALGLARRMFQDCLRAPGKSISSGYKYLEYEKRQGSGEWRLLAELFTESVRFFRHPPSPEALPQQQRCHLSLSPLSPLSPPPRRRRKASPEARVVAGEALSCGRCRRLLEDTHFVQCPAVPRHRFCFPCARRAIRARGPGSAVHCPSGGRCPLAGSGLPWAFMQGEIAAILAGDVRVKRERDP
ncbi:PREDICTED: interferon regulatory factor 2-binding protein 1-like [Sturnus vulgaris]|uniref:interferon regulatory factor 2-binding protein 1-like n=1 Tax=Sturnus vulgaris TaxID=9172 RepID=UPI00071A7123|nr:PREDICTED: interferon regulatory factor 2-binding protein 1-like [Sturnus vulgaris]